MLKKLRIPAMILAVLLLIPTAALAVGGTFTDDDHSVFEADIEWMVANGITYGCSETEYCPEGNVTRGQMAAFLHRFADNLVGDGVVGPEGPQGPAGVNGLNGANGADGATGPAGADGADGVAGAAGTDGIDGVIGPRGLPGANGEQGPIGLTGPVGPAGGTVNSPLAVPAMSFLTNGARGYDEATGSIRDAFGRCFIYPLTLPQGVTISEVGASVMNVGDFVTPVVRLKMREFAAYSTSVSASILLAEAWTNETNGVYYANVTPEHNGGPVVVDNSTYVYYLEACNDDYTAGGTHLYGATVEFHS